MSQGELQLKTRTCPTFREYSQCRNFNLFVLLFRTVPYSLLVFQPFRRIEGLIDGVSRIKIVEHQILPSFNCNLVEYGIHDNDYNPNLQYHSVSLSNIPRILLISAGTCTWRSWYSSCSKPFEGLIDRVSRINMAQHSFLPSTASVCERIESATCSTHQLDYQSTAKDSKQSIALYSNKNQKRFIKISVPVHISFLSNSFSETIDQQFDSSQQTDTLVALDTGQ